MRTVIIILLVGFFIVAGQAQAASSREQLTNDDIIGLINVKASNELILQKMATSDNIFDDSTTALIKLKRAGVPEQIITEMVRQAQGGKRKRGKRIDLRIQQLASEKLEIRSGAFLAIQNLGTAAFPILREKLSTPRAAIRRVCANALGKLGDKESAPLLRTLLDDAVPGVRYAAAGALAALGDDLALKTARAALTSTGDSATLDAYIRLIGMRRDRRSVDNLLITVLKAHDPKIRSQATWALGAIGLQRAHKTLEGVARNDSKPIVRRAAAKALGTLQVPASVAVLKQMCKDDAFARRDALLAMGEFQKNEVVVDYLILKGLLVNYERLNDAEVDAILRSLRKLTSQDFGRDVQRWELWWRKNRHTFARGNAAATPSVSPKNEPPELPQRQPILPTPPATQPPNIDAEKTKTVQLVPPPSVPPSVPSSVPSTVTATVTATVARVKKKAPPANSFHAPELITRTPLKNHTLLVPREQARASAKLIDWLSDTTAPTAPPLNNDDIEPIEPAEVDAADLSALTPPPVPEAAFVPVQSTPAQVSLPPEAPAPTLEPPTVPASTSTLAPTPPREKKLPLVVPAIITIAPKLKPSAPMPGIYTPPSQPTQPAIKATPKPHKTAAPVRAKVTSSAPVIAARPAPRPRQPITPRHQHPAKPSPTPRPAKIIQPKPVKNSQTSSTAKHRPRPAAVRTTPAPRRATTAPVSQTGTRRTTKVTRRPATAPRHTVTPLPKRVRMTTRAMTHYPPRPVRQRVVPVPTPVITKVSPYPSRTPIVTPRPPPDIRLSATTRLADLPRSTPAPRQTMSRQARKTYTRTRTATTPRARVLTPSPRRTTTASRPLRNRFTTDEYDR